MMERLDFSLPDFARVIWASKRAHDVWGQRLERIVETWAEVEVLSIALGLRRCAVMAVSNDNIAARVLKCGELGLQWLSLGIEPPVDVGRSRAVADESAQASPPSRLVVGRPGDLPIFEEASHANDHLALAQFLGYPTCCYEAFRSDWVQEGLIDATWSMAERTEAVPPETRTVKVTGASEANILWRAIGVRGVPHPPCRFDCVPTIALGRTFDLIGRDAGFGLELDWLQQILAWPVEWSALHGIAEVKTPILKICHNTDSTGRKYTVQREGNAYPVEGAQGLCFPYRQPSLATFSCSHGFKRGLDQRLPTMGESHQTLSSASESTEPRPLRGALSPAELGACPSIAFSRRHSNNPVTLGIR
jgi:hypothetical protein